MNEEVTVGENALKNLDQWELLLHLTFDLVLTALVVKTVQEVCLGRLHRLRAAPL